MAEFCSKCSNEHGFGEDICIKAEFSSIPKGMSLPVLCEGCAMLSIGRTKNDECIVYLGRLHPDEEKRCKWHLYNIVDNTIGEEYKQSKTDKHE